MKKKRNIIILQAIMILIELFILIYNIINFDYESIYCWCSLFIFSTIIGIAFFCAIIYLLIDIEKYFKNKNKE